VALWVEDARSAYEETMKRGAKSFMEPTVERTKMVKWFVLESILTVKLFIFVNRKNYNGIFCQAIKNGNQIIIKTNRFKIH
jgi:4-hydroxyphenylpyruvate dioxygenase